MCEKMFRPTRRRYVGCTLTLCSHDRYLVRGSREPPAIAKLGCQRSFWSSPGRRWRSSSPGRSTPAPTASAARHVCRGGTTTSAARHVRRGGTTSAARHVRWCSWGTTTSRTAARHVRHVGRTPRRRSVPPSNDGPDELEADHDTAASTKLRHQRADQLPGAAANVVVATKTHVFFHFGGHLGIGRRSTSPARIRCWGRRCSSWELSARRSSSPGTAARPAAAAAGSTAAIAADGASVVVVRRKRLHGRGRRSRSSSKQHELRLSAAWATGGGHDVDRSALVFGRTFRSFWGRSAAPAVGATVQLNTGE